MLAFASTLDAVRCCHAAQAHILFTSWPAVSSTCRFAAHAFTRTGIW